MTDGNDGPAPAIWRCCDAEPRVLIYGVDSWCGPHLTDFIDSLWQSHTHPVKRTVLRRGVK